MCHLAALIQNASQLGCLDGMHTDSPTQNTFSSGATWYLNGEAACLTEIYVWEQESCTWPSGSVSKIRTSNIDQSLPGQVFL